MKDGSARAKKLSAKERSDIAKKAAEERWEKERDPNEIAKATLDSLFGND